MLRKKFVVHSDSWNILWKGKKLRDFSIINRHELQCINYSLPTISLLFQNSFFNFYVEDNCFTILLGFCHTSTWISRRYAHVPSLLSLPPTSHTNPPCFWLSLSTGFGLPASYSKFPLPILHMALFQCYSFNSSLPLFPPLCPQVYFLCLCLHCSPANRFISTIFLYIYTLI